MYVDKCILVPDITEKLFQMHLGIDKILVGRWMRRDGEIEDQHTLALATLLVWRIFLDVSRYFSVPVVLANGPLALPLVLPGPVCLLAVLAAVGRVPAAPVDSLRLALVTLSRKYFC